MISTSTRNRRAGLWIGAAAVVAVLGTAIPALALDQPRTAPAAPAQAAAAAPAASYQGPAAGPQSREAAGLQRLVITLAGEANGRAEVSTDDPRHLRALVRTERGAFEIAAFIDDDPDGVARWAESCRLDGEGVDGRSCRPLLERRALGLWDRTYPQQPGRRSLTAAATTRAGGTLTVVISNLTETGPGGAKVIGPDWKRVGITVSEVRAALRATGLTVR